MKANQDGPVDRGKRGYAPTTAEGKTNITHAEPADLTMRSVDSSPWCLLSRGHQVFGGGAYYDESPSICTRERYESL